MFQFITRTGKLTETMPRLYVSCHPEDFEQHFRLICSDIFAVQENCAIFYSDDPAGDYDEDELFTLLGAMRLVIVPVTQKLISGNSRAMDVEIPFAIKKNIPILPIMVEENKSRELVEAFNKTEVFHGLQYLNRYSKDPTAMRYQDKLVLFLKSVILSEENIQRVLNEFSSKIFISYRKKDRKYALDLMRRIKQTDICRDTAIWYDEYLVPGESYNKNIMEALDNCNLFILSVSPAFEEPGNYVAKHEYPEALRKNKPYIAADMNHFDKGSRDNLESMYPGINEHMVDPEDIKNLENILKRRLTEEAGISENKLLNDEKEHTYYIALAYKNGISTLTDPERATVIFHISAEHGFHRAYLELIRMFRLGDGVPKDPDTALDYCKKAESVLKPIAGSAFETDNCLASVYEEKGHIYTGQMRKEDALQAYRAAFELRKEMQKKYEKASLRDYCESMLAVVSQMFSDGLFEEAEKIAVAFVDENKIITDYFERDPEGNPDDLGMLYVRSRIYSLLSAIYIQLKKHNEVIKYAEYRVSVCERIESITGSFEDYESLADAYVAIADFLKNTDPASANMFMEKYEEMRERLFEYRKNGSRSISDAIDTMSLADNTLLRAFDGDDYAFAKAEALYNEVLNICEGLSDGEDRYNALLLSANVYKRFGSLEKASGGSARKAADHFQTALAICRKAGKEFRNDPRLMLTESALLDEIGTIYFAAGDLTSATQYYTDAIEIDMRSARLNNSPEARHNLAKSYMRSADINKARGHQGISDVNNRSALKVLEPLVKETEDYRIIEDLAAAYFRLALSEKLASEQRTGYCQKAIETYEILEKMTNYAEEYVKAKASAKELLAAILQE